MGMIRQQNLRYPLHQWDAKPKPIITWSFALALKGVCLLFFTSGYGLQVSRTVSLGKSGIDGKTGLKETIENYTFI